MMQFPEAIVKGPTGVGCMSLSPLATGTWRARGRRATRASCTTGPVFVDADVLVGWPTPRTREAGGPDTWQVDGGGGRGRAGRVRGAASAPYQPSHRYFLLDEGRARREVRRGRRGTIWCRH